MNRAHLLVLILFALSTCWVKSEDKLLNTTNGQVLANELTQKLGAMGSFEAEYHAIGSHKRHANITVLFNNYQKYFLASFGEDKPDVYFVVDFSEANDVSGNIEFLWVSGRKGWTIKMSPKNVMIHPDNPIGVLLSILKVYESETKATPENAEFPVCGPTLDLGLDSSSITISGGVSSQSTNLMVSWLDQDTISNAVNVAETLGSVQFSYSSNHIVSVDEKTGLLLKDSFPPGIREITLENYSTRQYPRPYSALIPGFDTIKFKEMPAKKTLDQFYDSFLTSYGRELAALSNFDQILRTNSARIASGARETGRRMVDDNFAKAAGLEKSAVKYRKVSLSLYKDFLRHPPIDVNDLSYTNLLNSAITLYQTNSNDLEIPADIEWLAREDAKLLIKKLPKDTQRPLFKLYDVVMPALAQGAMAEFIVISCTEAKKMGEPSDLNPEKAAAYYKRGCIRENNGDLAGAKYDFERALELKPGNSAIMQKLIEMNTR